jgi:hypothetical protein
MKRLVALAVAAAALTGCASNSGVVPIGRDSFMITNQAATGFSGPGALKADAIREASAFCASQSKEVHLLHTSDSKPPYILGNYPRTEIQFACLSKNDPDYTRSRLQKEPDSIVEIKR